MKDIARPGAPPPPSFPCLVSFELSESQATMTMSASGSVPAGTRSLTHSRDVAVAAQWQHSGSRVTRAQMAGAPALGRSLISLLLFGEQ